MPTKFVKFFAVTLLLAVSACSDNGVKDVAGKWVRGDFSIDFNAEKSTVDYVRLGQSWLTMEIVKTKNSTNEAGQQVFLFDLEMLEIVPPQRKGLSIEQYEEEQAKLKAENEKHKGKASKLRVRIVSPNRIEAQITHPLGISKEYTEWLPFVRYGSGETIAKPQKMTKKQDALKDKAEPVEDTKPEEAEKTAE